MVGRDEPQREERDGDADGSVESDGGATIHAAKWIRSVSDRPLCKRMAISDGQLRASVGGCFGTPAQEACRPAAHHHQSTRCPWCRCQTTHDVQIRMAARLAINDPAENATMVFIVCPYSCDPCSHRR